MTIGMALAKALAWRYNVPMKLLLPALCLLLVSCSDSKGMGNEAPVDDTVLAMAPGIRPVRIGEGGPGFNACQYVGRVANISPTGETYLPLRAAPFLEAEELNRLPNDTRLFVCTRSIDQRWQGVVVPPADAPDSDCGVAAPVATARNYTGRCRSGWVSSAFVRLIAN